ncbi:MAG: hypothetical protein O8C67_13740 [Candidatus Methanoperedens sp.]|nr:hypothetical protein [Candidatus Methanoperedens sp.]
MGLTITPASPDNEAIRELRDSSKRLEKLMEKLSASTEQLSNYSERLEFFTLVLIGITVFLAMIAVTELFKDFLSKYEMAILGFSFLAVIVIIVYYLVKIGNKKYFQK